MPTGRLDVSAGESKELREVGDSLAFCLLQKKERRKNGIAYIWKI
jgi:hypothetical protein